MKIPVQLSKGLTAERQKQLESELKNSVLAERLREHINASIDQLELTEEAIDITVDQLYSMIGQRRGYRHILNLLPED